MPEVNEALFDAAVRHEVFLQRFGGSLANRIIALLNRSDADLVLQIAARLERMDRDVRRGFDPGPATTARLERLLDEIRLQSRDLYVAVGKELRGELYDLAEAEARIAATRLSEAIGADFQVLRPAPELLRAAVTAQPFRGRLLRDWVSGLDRAKVARLSDAIRIGLVQGETNDQIIRRIRGTRANNFRDGILEATRRHAEAVTRTAVNHVSSRSRDLLYQANADVIKAVRWTSTLDSRTTAVCRARDGLVFPLDSGPRPPAHIRCRSTMSPVTKSWRELSDKGDLKPGRGARDIDTLFQKNLKARGFSPEAIREIKRNTRASMNGQVSGDLTYSDWLRRQPREFQDDVLGVRKARLFRDGGLNLDRFVDIRTGREFTLQELERKEAEAWMRAGLNRAA